MQSASETFLVLSSLCCTRSGTISIVLDGSHTLCSNLVILVACDVVTLRVLKILLELSLVVMKGSPCSPALDVDPVSLIVDRIVPFRTPILTSASFRWYFSFWLLRFSFTFCHNVLLFLPW